MKKLRMILLPWVLALIVTGRAAIVPGDAQQNASPPLTSVGGKKSSPVDDVLQFANGDVLHGTVVGCDDAGLRVQSSYSSASSVFRTANLIEVLFHPRALPAGASKPASDILLVNGDLLPGEVVSLDDKTLVLETWYAGKLNIPRAMVAAIGKSGFPYEGPTGMDGWVLTPAQGPGWTYSDGTFSTAACAAIGRSIRFPLLSRVQFDAVPGGNSQLNVYLCFDRTGKIGRSYLIQFSYGNGFDSVELFHYDGGISRQEGQVTKLDNQPQPPGKTHFDIRVDKKSKTITLFINGQRAQQYSNLDDLADLGGSLIFTPGDSWNAGWLGASAQQTERLRIEKIQVGIWDGGTAEGKPAPQTGGDGMELTNGDAIHGRLNSIAGGKLDFVSSGSGAAIPLDDVDVIYLAHESTKPEKHGVNDVRASLPGDGTVTMELESWKDGKAAVSSPDFGKAVFMPEAFQKLEFNLDQPPAKPVAPDQPSPSPSHNRARDSDLFNL